MTYISLSFFVNLGPVVEVSAELVSGSKVFRFVTLNCFVDVEVLFAEGGQHGVFLSVHHVLPPLVVQIMYDFIFGFAV